MTELKTLRDHTTEVTIRPAVGSRLRVMVEDKLFDESRVVWGVSVYGDGRIFYHDEADRHDDAITNAWTRELVKAACDAHQPNPCLHEGNSCIAHDWHGEGRCPHARLTDILAALDQPTQEPK